MTTLVNRRAVRFNVPTEEHKYCLLGRNNELVGGGGTLCFPRCPRTTIQSLTRTLRNFWFVLSVVKVQLTGRTELFFLFHSFCAAPDFFGSSFFILFHNTSARSSTFSRSVWTFCCCSRSSQCAKTRLQLILRKRSEGRVVKTRRNTRVSRKFCSSVLIRLIRMSVKVD